MSVLLQPTSTDCPILPSVPGDGFAVRSNRQCYAAQLLDVAGQLRGRFRQFRRRFGRHHNRYFLVTTAHQDWRLGSRGHRARTEACRQNAQGTGDPELLSPPDLFGCSAPAHHNDTSVVGPDALHPAKHLDPFEGGRSVSATSRAVTPPGTCRNWPSVGRAAPVWTSGRQ